MIILFGLCSSVKSKTLGLELSISWRSGIGIAWAAMQLWLFDIRKLRFEARGQLQCQWHLLCKLWLPSPVPTSMRARSNEGTVSAGHNDHDRRVRVALTAHALGIAESVSVRETSCADTTLARGSPHSLFGQQCACVSTRHTGLQSVCGSR